MEAVTSLPKLLTPLEVALWLSLTTREVLRMARARKIPCRVLPGGEFLFDSAELRHWLEGLRDGGPDHAA